jgi:hypothetical protein
MKKEGKTLTFAFLASSCVLFAGCILTAVIWHLAESFIVRMLTLSFGLLIMARILLIVLPSPFPRYNFDQEVDDESEDKNK